MRVVGKIVALSVAMVVGLVVGAPPAAAHSSRNGRASDNYETRIVSIDPAVPGVDITVIELGDRIQVTNTTAVEVIVPGYEGEPYLRVGPDGVFENRRSPATILNRGRQTASLETAAVGGVELDAEAEAEWVQISTGQVARWHDHRAHFMGTIPPQVVIDSPDAEHLVTTFTIPFGYGDDLILVNGDLRWVPGSSPVPWWIAAVAIALSVAAISQVRAERLRRELLFFVSLLLIVVDVLHSVGVAAFRESSFTTQLGDFASGAAIALPGWLLGTAGLVLVRKGKPDAWFAFIFLGASVALLGGVLELGVLNHSQVPSIFDPAIVRASVVVSLGGGVGLVVASAFELRRNRSVVSAD